jgi:hypothetical protein
MFAYSPFRGDLSKWNVENVRYYSNIFSHSGVKKDIRKNYPFIQKLAKVREDKKFRKQERRKQERRKQKMEKKFLASINKKFYSQQNQTNW